MLSLMPFGGDFEQGLKTRRLVAVCAVLVGIVGFISYGLLVPDSSLGDAAKGFYLGAATGITLGGIILLLRTHYLLTHPEARKKARIHTQDEREQAIISQSFQFAGLFTFFAGVAALFVLVAVSPAAAQAVFCVIVVFSITFLFRVLYLSKTR